MSLLVSIFPALHEQEIRTRLTAAPGVAIFAATEPSEWPEVKLGNQQVTKNQEIKVSHS